MSGGSTFPGVRVRAGGTRRAFTLIELLVVISIIALLMAILMPTLQRVRKQARAVVCQSQLRQWGTLVATYLNENSGRFPGRPSWDDPGRFESQWGWGWGWGGLWPSPEAEKHRDLKDIRCCPMAAKLADPTASGRPTGGTFLAWGRLWSGDLGERMGSDSAYGSYGFNGALGDYYYFNSALDGYWQARIWRTADVRGRDRIPVYFDSAWLWSGAWAWEDGSIGPPECDAIPITLKRDDAVYAPCINRHDGGINVVFLDGSVRKVGLKELWTLKWHRQFDTAGPWTKAGGAEPGDWPQWVRRFKDY